MSRARKVVSEIQNELRDTLQAHWRLLLFQGVAMLILSILALAGPAVATIAVDIYVGWLLLISGFVGVVAAFATRDVPAFLWTLLTAILSMVVGAMLIWKPAEGAMSLTIVFTAFFLAEGVFRIIVSFTYRDAVPGSWGWVLASGIFDLVLANHHHQLARQRHLDPRHHRGDQLVCLRLCRRRYRPGGTQRRAICIAIYRITFIENSPYAVNVILGDMITIRSYWLAMIV